MGISHPSKVMLFPNEGINRDSATNWECMLTNSENSTPPKTRRRTQPPNNGIALLFLVKHPNAPSTLKKRNTPN